MPKTKALTIKQEKFVNNVLEGRSYRDAALHAGYTSATAKNADKNIVAKRGIQEELTKRLGQQGIDADWVLANLKQDVEKTADCPNPVRTRSLELIGKAKGLFSERSGESVADNKGMPKVMRNAVRGDILEVVRKWEAFTSQLNAFVKTLPEDKRIEAEGLFNDETMFSLLNNRLDFTRKIEGLGFDIAKRMIVAAGISWDSLFQKPSKNHV